MRWFVSSDIHSFYDEWMQALHKEGFDINNKDHGIIILGDLLDRGKKPIECLKFAIDLHKQDRAIFINGNHEQLLDEAITRGRFKQHDIHNGTVETACCLANMNLDYSDKEILEAASKNELWIYYYNNLTNYYEFKDNIFVHGWIPTKSVQDIETKNKFKDLPEMYIPYKDVYDPDWRNRLDFEWDEAIWKNGMKCWNAGLGEEGKTIWCGHFHTSWGHCKLHNDGKEFLSKIETYYIDPDTGKEEPHVNFTPFIDEKNGCKIIAMDACTAISHFVNCINIQ